MAVTVRVNKENETVVDGEVKDVIELQRSRDKEINWLVEGVAGDTVVIAFQVRKGSSKYNRRPFNKRMGDDKDVKGATYVFHFDETKKEKRGSTGNVKTPASKAKTETWKFTVFRVGSNGQPKGPINDPKIRVRGD